MEMFLAVAGMYHLDVRIRHPGVSLVVKVAAGKYNDLVSTKRAVPFAWEIGGADEGAFYTDSPIEEYIHERIW